MKEKNLYFNLLHVVGLVSPSDNMIDGVSVTTFYYWHLIPIVTFNDVIMTCQQLSLIT